MTNFELGLEFGFNTYSFIILGIALFIYIFPKLTEFLTIAGTGFIVGYWYVAPNLYRYLTEYGLIKESFDTTFFTIIVSLVISAILYGLYKTVIFIGAGILVFLAGYNLIVNYLHISNLTIVIPAIILLGLIAGLIASKKSADFIAIFAVFVSSYIISTFLVGLAISYISLNNEVIIRLIAIALLMILFFFRTAKLLTKES